MCSIDEFIWIVVLGGLLLYWMLVSVFMLLVMLMCSGRCRCVLSRFSSGFSVNRLLLFMFVISWICVL